MENETRDIVDYKDPSDKDKLTELLNRIKTIKNPDEYLQFMNEVFPTWLLYTIERYSKDYPTLENNWKVICDKIGCSKKKIVIVDGIYHDNDHLLLNIFCEQMTREGYIVRRYGELSKCISCESAIPSEQVYEKMKSNGIKVPSKWSNKCSTC